MLEFTLENSQYFNISFEKNLCLYQSYKKWKETYNNKSIIF